jgi:lysophospholipase L1-like esterase
MKKVILIGDSIRIGYSPFVARELEGEAEIWGPEANGGTSRNILANLDEWVIARDADVVHINCGLHDLARDWDEDGTPRVVRVPLEEYSPNVRRILSRIQESGKKVIWATTTPVHEENHKSKGFDRLEGDVLRYNEAATRVAGELGVPVNDLYRVVQDAGEASGLLPDGVHFTPEGSTRLGNAVAQSLRENW